MLQNVYYGAYFKIFDTVVALPAPCQTHNRELLFLLAVTIRHSIGGPIYGVNVHKL